MIFKQHKDGSCDIEFSWKERLILLRKGKLNLPAESLKHFGNYLVKMVSDWQLNFNKETLNKQTFTDTKIDTK